MTVKELINKYQKKLWETRPNCSNRNRSVELAKDKLLKEILIDLSYMEEKCSNSTIVSDSKLKEGT